MGKNEERDRKMGDKVKYEGKKRSKTKTFSVRVVKHDIAEASRPKSPGHPVITANSPQTSIRHSEKQTHTRNTYFTYFFSWNNYPNKEVNKHPSNKA